MKHSILSWTTGVVLIATCGCWINGPALGVEAGVTSAKESLSLTPGACTDSVTSTNSAVGTSSLSGCGQQIRGFARGAVTSAQSNCQNSNCTFFRQVIDNQAAQVQVAPATVTLTEVYFYREQVAKNNGQTLVRLELAPSPGVPANTVVRVEAFVATNPNGVAFSLSPNPANKEVTVSGGSGTYLVDFVLTTIPKNAATGQINFRGRILEITSGNSAIPVQSRPVTPDDAVQSTRPLTVQP